MNAHIFGLRDKGVPIDTPSIRSLADIPAGLVLEGHMEYGTVQGRRGRCLHLRAYMSAPGCGVQAVLYQPVLAQVEHSFLKFRGFEPMEDGAVYMQEWLVFPK